MKKFFGFTVVVAMLTGIAVSIKKSVAKFQKS